MERNTEKINTLLRENCQFDVETIVTDGAPKAYLYSYYEEQKISKSLFANKPGNLRERQDDR